MKKILLSTLIALSAFSMVATNADAKRLGGGGSVGHQSTNVSRQAMPAPASPSAGMSRPSAPAAAPAAVPAAKPASPWRGMLGGALLGLGAGALLSHLGLGGAMGGMLGSILMIALLAVAGMFVFRMFKRKNENQTMTPATAYGGNNSNTIEAEAPYARSTQPELGPVLPGSTGSGSGFGSTSAIAPAAVATAANAGTWTIPADFDVPAFLRNAKTYFIRLQAAWDKADLNDIREFTTTEMFAEFRLELQERGASANITDVVRLDAEMLGVETLNNEYLASVKFTGLIKEDPAADATQFAEVWNLSKPLNGQGGWVLAGIQQLS